MTSTSGAVVWSCTANAVTVGRQTYLGTRKSGKNRTVVLPAFVTDAVAQTAEGKGRDELLWPSLADVGRSLLAATP